MRPIAGVLTGVTIAALLLAACVQGAIPGPSGTALVITAPEDGSEVTVGAPLAVRAVVDDGTTLSSTPRLLVGAASVAELEAHDDGAYSTSFTFAAAGDYRLTVLADTAAGDRVKDEVQIRVVEPADPADGTGDGGSGSDDGGDVGTDPDGGPGGDDGAGGPEYDPDFDLAQLTGTSDYFTIGVVPDTQNMIGQYQADNDMTATMVEWLVDTVTPMNTVFVTHLGDVVDRGWNLYDWVKADASFDPLDGVVPYSIAFGDHDYRREEQVDSPVKNYLDHFGPSRYQGYEWYGGSNPRGTSHFQIFTGGTWEFLHIALEWEPPGPADDPSTPLGWARGVIEAHPGMPTIISTHAYLWDEPGQEGYFTKLEGYYTEDDGTRVYPGSDGHEIFTALVEPYPQVFMVLNGHYHRATGTDEGEFHQVSSNSAGLPVFEMLSNYQSYPNGGDGWLRLIHFLPGAGANGSDRILVRTYSPVKDQFQEDPRSLFHFDLSFTDRFQLD